MNGFTIPPRADLRWLGIDLDGTIAEGLWTPDNPTHAVGNPIPANVTKLRDAYLAGWKGVIHTARPWTDYEVIEAWLRHHDIPFRGIVCGKLLAAAYVDDRAINAAARSWIPS